MAITTLILNMVGGLCMFLYGMKVMSDGLQKSAGERMRKTLNFMTGNRFIGLLTGFLATAIIQSSSAFSVIVVSFVNAGLLTLTQSIGVIFGTNIGTTLTGWIISLIGFKLSIESLALPAIGIGFIASVVKWKYRSVGDFMVGFGFLFLGLHFLTAGMGTDTAKDILDFNAIGALRNHRVLAMLIGFGVGLVMTLIINSSTASITLIMALAFQDIVTYEMAAGMVLGANLGTTLDAPLASLAGNASSKRTALVHVLFNIIGVAWALPLLFPLLKLVNIFLPGDPWTSPEAIPLHIAGLHTTFNIINTIFFLPFVNQFAALVTVIIPEKISSKEEAEHYKFIYPSTSNANSPEFNILRAEKEISNMAGIVSIMYSRFCKSLRALHESSEIAEDSGAVQGEPLPELNGIDMASSAAALCEELLQKEQYIDEMRETLTGFLIDCSSGKISRGTENRISNLLRIIGILEDMSDECYSVSCLLEKSIRKNNMFKGKEMDKLIPYVGEVEEFLALLEEQLSRGQTIDRKIRAAEIERSIDKNRKKLNKLGRKRIEAGRDVKTELLFIDLVHRIEKLGDYCFSISEVV